MTYQKLRVTRNRYLATWILFAIALASVSVLGFFDSITNRLVSDPDYTEAFAIEFAKKYHAKTGYSVIISRAGSVVEDVPSVMDRFLQDTDEQREKVASQDKKEAKGEAKIDMKKFVTSRPGVTRLTIDSSAMKLYFLHLTQITPKDDVKLPEWIKAMTVPVKGNVVYGHTSYKDVIPTEDAVFNLSETDLANFHWSSQESPNFSVLNSELHEKLNMFGSKDFESFIDDEMVETVKSKVGNKFNRVKFILRYILFPGIFLILVAQTGLLYSWYRLYLKEFKLLISPPGFFTSFFSRDLPGLTKSTKALLSKVPFKELRFRAESSSKGEKSAALRSKSGKAKKDYLPCSIDPKEQRLKRNMELSQQFLDAYQSADGNLTAWAIYEDGLVSDDLSKQRDLFTQAIRELKNPSKPSECDSWKNGKSKKVSSEKVLPPDVFLTLKGRLDELFPVPDYLPSGVDGRMAREILVALLDPGHKVNLFGSNYRPTDALKRMVNHRYEKLSLRFSTPIFNETIEWMVVNRVLFRKPKTAEQVISLYSRLSDVKSPEAKRLLAAINDVNDKLTS